VKTALLDVEDHQQGELLIVEGCSAASTIKPLRDRQRQAILPMQGKIPNALKSSVDKLEQHVQIADLLQSLHPQRKVQLEFKNFRYQRVVLFNDPDTDGMHAGMLLILFIYRYLPELIKQGLLYTVQVPLYGFYKYGECISRAYTHRQMEELSAEYLSDESAIEVRRFKSVASVDQKLLLECLAPEYDRRSQLSFTECERLCSIFSQ